MMYEFSADIKSINKDYKAEDGWPLFIDKFVEFLHSKGKWFKLDIAYIIFFIELFRDEGIHTVAALSHRANITI